jgi:hypothetical protein
VVEVEDRWFSPKTMYFQVVAYDGNRYEPVTTRTRICGAWKRFGRSREERGGICELRKKPRESNPLIVKAFGYFRRLHRALNGGVQARMQLF